MFHTFAVWFLVFIAYSFIGWLYEVIIALVLKRHFNNRGFLIGPICPIYGTGALLITALLWQHSDNLFSVFIISIIGSGLLEYGTSFIMEKIFHVRWWDYSDQRFNLNGRISLVALVAFGLLGVLVIRVLNPALLALFESIDPKYLEIIATAALTLFMVDIVGSICLIISFRATTKTVSRDVTEEVSQYLRQTVMAKGQFSRRLVKAFPDLEVKQTRTRKTKTTASRSTSSRKSTKRAAKKPAKKR